ncbi:30S ribosomal protein S9 [Planctomycetota bacterium]
MPEVPFFQGTGRRKTAIAEVRLRKGTGQITINDQEYDKYFTALQERTTIVNLFQTLKIQDRYDISAWAYGGGKNGQADAVILGISRALKKADPALEPLLRQKKLLTRDPRMKERKKYGYRGARRGNQWTKR